MTAPRHDADRPWGHWLRLEPRRDLRTLDFIDTDGRNWRSVREAFWVGRLGMPLVAGEVPDEQVELVHAVLAARIAPGSSRTYPDILPNLTMAHFMQSWLASVGLLEDGPGHPLDRGLSVEGLSVLRMLDLTRPHPLGSPRAGRASVDELMLRSRDHRIDAERRDRTEAAAEGWEVAFLRRTVAGRAAVVLVQRGDEPTAVMTTVWMLRFPDVHLRDVFYDWLCVRLDRWPAWGAIAGSYGGPELTSHLLQSLVAS